MTTRIAFTTKYPARMGDKAGKRNYFPEKILKGLGLTATDRYAYKSKLGLSGLYDLDAYNLFRSNPKTTTIRKKYKFWKLKEGQMIQPFIWSGKPYRSKHVLFCPPVRLKNVEKIRIKRGIFSRIKIEHDYGNEIIFEDEEESQERFAKSEGFDSADDFFLWFNEDFEGAYLRFGE